MAENKMQLEDCRSALEAAALNHRVFDSLLTRAQGWTTSASVLSSTFQRKIYHQ